MKVKFFLLAILLFHLINAQDIIEHKLNNIVISAARVPVAFSGSTRSIALLDSAKLNNKLYNNFTDLLKNISSIDLRQRGNDGVQADISIRGGNFDQTLIVIDGIKFSDPQTGHHNLNLPINLNSVERIEILKGQGTRSFGANAFSGVINIITKKNNQPKINLDLSLAQNSTYGSAVTATYPLGNFDNVFSLSYGKSNGYKHNTGYNNFSANFKSTYNFTNGNINLFTGINNKEFGANGFYSSAFPNQWEKISAKMININANLWFENILFSLKTFFREHNDEYLLDFSRPSFYRNLHDTYVKGIEFQVNYDSYFGTTSVGGDIGEDKIISSNLGNHQRNKYGVFLEHQLNIAEKLTINAGVFAYKYHNVGWKYWPGIDLAYKINENIKLFGSVGQAFRLPTFTDLYYKSPTINGNVLLNHEETTNYEFGLDYTNKYIFTNISYFVKDGKNIIDWVKNNTNQWIAENIADIRISGLEINMDLNSRELIKSNFIKSFSIGYVYLNADKSTGNKVSRYLLEHLKHQFILTITHQFMYGIESTINLRFEDRVNSQTNFNTDIGLQKRFDIFTIYANVNNLFNASQQDFTGLELRKRWIGLGVRLDLL